jgi:hypothetical protein
VGVGAEPNTEPLDDVAKPSPAAAPPSGAFAHSRFRFSSGVRGGETVAIRDQNGSVLLTYRSFASVVGIVATLVSVIVVVTGAAAVIFLFAEGRPLPAMLAFILSAAFAVIIAMLVPPIHVTLYESAHPVLVITQRSNVSFPAATYVVTAPDRTVVARFRKTAWSRFGRNRWQILDSSERPIGEAIEESYSRAMLGKIAGKFNPRYQSNVVIQFLGKQAGTFARRPNGTEGVEVLVLNGNIDPRIAVALTTLIAGSEP